MLSSLSIDITLREADYAKFYQDVEAAKSGYERAIEYCKEYPEGNKKILGSAYFSLGALFLEMNQRDNA